MKYTIYSHFNSKTGLAEVAEGIGVALVRQGHDVVFHSLGNWPEFTDPLKHDMMKRRKHQPSQSIGVFCWSPEEINKVPDHSKLVCAAFVESTKARRSIVDACNRSDLVLTFSEFCRKVLLDSGVGKPIGVSKPGLNDVYRRPISRRKTGTTFLCVGVAQDRKNMAVAEYVFRKCFPNEFFPDVRLVLKSNHCGDLDWVAKEQNISTVWTGNTVGVPDLDSNQMLSLYHQADCLLMPSKGEGIGMPALEGAATGLPVIYTNFSSPAEYFNDSTGWPIPFKMEKAFQSGYPFSGEENGEWALIDQQDLAWAMRDVAHNKKAAQAKGAKAALEMSGFGWDAPANLIASFSSQS